ncbi:MAG: ABC transporter substrate-binding protein, partial [Syntrophaceae bacterium]
MKRMRSKWAVLTAGLILLSAVSAGSAFGAEPVKGKVMIYSSIYLHIIEQLKPVLKQKFPDLDVQWFYGGSEKVIAKLVAEFDQGASMADLIMIADPAYYNTLKREGRLLQYKSPNAKFVLPAWLDKDGY